MNKLIHAELQKLATIRWFKITMGITLVMAPAFTLLAVFAAKRAPDLGDEEFIHGVLSISAVSSLVMLGVGIATMAGEFRHGTSVPTFLITPRTTRHHHRQTPHHRRRRCRRRSHQLWLGTRRRHPVPEPQRHPPPRRRHHTNVARSDHRHRARSAPSVSPSVRSPATWSSPSSEQSDGATSSRA